MAREMARISPARICSAHFSMAVRSRSCGVCAGVAGSGMQLLFLSQELPRNNQLLDFASAFADGAELYVAIKLFRGIILDEAVAAVNLYALVGDADGDFAGKKFGHAGFAGEADVVLVSEPCGLVDKQASGFDLSGHIGEFKLDGLKFADGLAELLALLGVFNGSIECALRH